MCPFFSVLKSGTLPHLLAACTALNSGLAVSTSTTLNPLSQCSTRVPLHTIFAWFHSPAGRSRSSSLGSVETSYIVAHLFLGGSSLNLGSGSSSTWYSGPVSYDAPCFSSQR